MAPIILPLRKVRVPRTKPEKHIQGHANATCCNRVNFVIGEVQLEFTSQLYTSIPLHSRLTFVYSSCKKTGLVCIAWTKAGYLHAHHRPHDDQQHFIAESSPTVCRRPIEVILFSVMAMGVRADSKKNEPKTTKTETENGKA